MKVGFAERTVRKEEEKAILQLAVLEFSKPTAVWEIQKHFPPALTAQYGSATKELT